MTIMETFLVELGKSGPWALVAGWLLWNLVKERQSFQTKVVDILDEFKVALIANTNALTALTAKLDEEHRRN